MLATGVYLIQCPSPTFSPLAGTYGAAQTVTISATGGATIRYTTDGTLPGETTGTVYSSPVNIASGTSTLQAIAYITGWPIARWLPASMTITVPYTNDLVLYLDPVNYTAGNWPPFAATTVSATQANPSEQPVFSASALNGRPGVVFNAAASDSLLTGNLTSLLTNAVVRRSLSMRQRIALPIPC